MKVLDLSRRGPRTVLGVLVCAVALAGCTAMRSGVVSQSALGAGDWKLVELNGQTAQPADASKRPWLRFVADSNRVQGFGGCNTLSGFFTRENGELRFGDIASTKRACADASLTQQEQAFANALGEIDRFEIVDGKLKLQRGSRTIAELTH